MLKRPYSIASSICLFAVVIAGCSKHSTPQSAPPPSREIDACALLTKEEIQALQGSPINDTKGSAHSAGAFRVAQCFYTAADFTKSVTLSVTQANPAVNGTRSAKDFWDETFHRSSEEAREKEEKEKEKEHGEEREGRLPTKIEGVGEEAYWSSNRFGGVFYVLGNGAFISISIGGPDSEQVKIDKSKTLAKKAIGRL